MIGEPFGNKRAAVQGSQDAWPSHEVTRICSKRQRRTGEVPHGSNATFLVRNGLDFTQHRTALHGTLVSSCAPRQLRAVQRQTQHSDTQHATRITQHTTHNAVALSTPAQGETRKVFSRSIPWFSPSFAEQHSPAGHTQDPVQNCMALFLSLSELRLLAAEH